MLTSSVATVGKSSGTVEMTVRAPGDGTVLRTSALMDERVGKTWSPQLASPIDWTHVAFFCVDHVTLTKHPAFVDNVLYLLLEDPRQRGRKAGGSRDLSRNLLRHQLSR